MVFSMNEAYRRHDISDILWMVIEPHTIGNKGTWGGNAKDTRQFINGVFWILRTGTPWRDLPPCYGNWNAVQRRFCRWRGIATRYAKHTKSFLAAVQIACTVSYLKSLI